MVEAFPHTAAADARQARILDAAERCFARGGFHRTTMADIAQEAGMSPGNLYRYFASKDAIVAQLCERDRMELAASFDALHGEGDPMEMLQAIGRRHLVDEPRHKAMLVAEIWAEAARNPDVARICRAFETDIHSRLGAFFDTLDSRGMMHPEVDKHALVDMLISFVDGVIVRRAREPDFDPAPSVAHVGDLIAAGTSGAIPSLLRGDARPAELPSSPHRPLVSATMPAPQGLDS